FFSILDAHTRIPPHTGVTNTRLTVHLPLIVPAGCGFRVGGETREWQVGTAWVFDDSIEHEAWNDSDVPRAILIFAIWNPALTPLDRESARLAALAEATPPLTPEDRFGLPRAVAPAKEGTGPRLQEATVLRARLRLVASRSDGLLAFTLDNGQVWRQLEPGSDLLARPGDAVQLSKGALGTYWLRGASGRTCRVVRDR
ncbi:MAG: aspartyl/asparaginyl beta-hydroxylase domain-containing protein, partial [Gammaproteobacteria bacterium]